jgi:hypothetical protein
MTNDNRADKVKGGKSAESSDSEASLQEELRKESAEGKDSVGDAGSNTNLSGASTWNTLPEEEADKESRK